MRLTGSLWTIVTQGTSGSGTAKTSSADSVRSISRGAGDVRLPMLACPPQIVTLTRTEVASVAMNTADLGLPVDVPSTALFTDQYEFTMLQAALRAGTAGLRIVFEVFTRRLPDGRRYGVVTGTGRVLDAVENFRFDADVLGFLRERGIVDEATLEWLAGYRVSGGGGGYPEGEVYFPGSPIMRVEGSFAECVLLETVILSILNFDSAIAAAASRMSSAAGQRPLIEMGARRTHELAAVAASRAAYVGGFA